MPRSIKGVAKKAQRDDAKLRKALDKVHQAKAFVTGDGRAKAIADSFQNFAANLGIGTNQIGAFDTYGFNPITRIHTLLEWIHRGSWVGGVAVDIVADDMTRAGVELRGELEPEAAQAIQEEAVLCNVWTAINDCIKWARLYGGCIGVMLIDGQDVETPFRLETVSKGMFKGILPLDRWMIEPDLTRLVRDYGPNLGNPSRYRVNASAPAFTNKWIDYSRIIRLEGIRLPYWQRLVENLWGESVIERLYDRMTAFDSATTGAAQLVHKLHVRTYGLKDFREIVSAGGDALQGLSRYVDMMRKFQSIEGMTLLDAEDKYEVHGSPAVAGVNDLLMQFGQQLAGALQVPLVRLFGMSPAGFNATGESDLRTYYDGILQQQERTLRVPLSTVYRAMAQSLGITLPDGFSLAFKPLWQLTDKEKAEVAQTISSAVTNAFDAGLLSQQTALQELRQSSEVSGVFSNITQEQIDAAEVELPPGLPTEEETAVIKAEGAETSAAIRSGAEKGKGQPKNPKNPSGQDCVMPPRSHYRLAVDSRRCDKCTHFNGIDKQRGNCNQAEVNLDAKDGFLPILNNMAVVEVRGWCDFFKATAFDAAHDSVAAMAWYHDLPVVIENPVGTERRGRGWEVKMPADYGYIRRVTGADGMELDCYVGPAPESSKVFVINQRKVHNGIFDEHKVMLGYHSQDTAVDDYMLGYPDGSGQRRMMDCYELNMDEFKQWMKTGDLNAPFRRRLS